MQFTKLHGCGNDFVLVTDLDDGLDIPANLVRAVCSRHSGVGADGLIRLAPARDGESDVFMDYRNSDGSIVEMCGNGVRCVATYILNHRLMSGDTVRVGSRAGTKMVVVTGRDAAGKVTETLVDMGAPRHTGTVRLQVPSVEPFASELSATTVSMGNPHAVVLVDDVTKVPLEDWGPRIEHDPAFGEGTNVEFIEIRSDSVVGGRIWERGVGETQASGTGVSAMAVAAHLLGHTGRAVRVDVPGGALHVDWTETTLFVRGPAVEVFTGRLHETWLRHARE